MSLRPRLRPLFAEQLSQVPPGCGDCPLGAGVPGVAADGSIAGWARAAQQEWGLCGISAHQNGDLAGYLLLCPPLHAPRNGPQGGGPRSPDAAVVLAIRVLAGATAQGLGRQLVQAAAARAARLEGIGALEVRGSRLVASCVLPPADFLAAVGFQVIVEDPVRPQFRLDLARTLRWRPGLIKPALDRLGDWIRPLPPEPVNRHRGPLVGQH